jgi:hypothetical protein
MAPVVTCYRSVFDTAGGVIRSRASLQERARSPRSYSAKADVGRYCDGRLSCRNLDGFQGTQSVTQDHDIEPLPTRAKLVAAFSDLAGFAYTTWRSTSKRPLYRVNVALSRFVADLDERDRVWRALAIHAERAGLAPHLQSRAACHPWALPARHDGDAYDYLEFEGEPFDVDAALEFVPAQEPLPEPAAYPLHTDLSHRLDRCRRYVDAMDPAIAGANGHAQCFRVACVVVRGFGIPDDHALEILSEYSGRCSPAWSRRELVHKIRQAARRGQMAFGALAERPLERRSA